MRFQRSAFSAVATVAVAMTVVAACSTATTPQGSKAGAGAPATIDFWYSVTGKPADTLTDLVKEFNASQDRVKVNAVFQGKYAETMSKLTNAVQSGGTPALLQGGDTFAAYLRDSKLGASPTEVETTSGKTFDAGTLVKPLKDYYTFEGELSSVPLMASQPVVFYHPALLKRAGVDVSKPPSSLSELFDIARKVHDTTHVPGVTFQFNEWFAEVFSASQGIAYCTPDNGVGSERPNAYQYTTDTQVHTWAKVQQLLRSGAMFNVGIDGDAAYNAFANGKSAMAVASSGALGNIAAAAKSDIGAWPLPVENRNGGAVPGGSSIWMLKEGSSDAQLSGAADFVSYLASPKVQSRVFTETGYLPSSQKALDSLVTKADGAEKALLKQLADSKGSSAALGCHSGSMGEARPFVRTAIEQIATGTDPAKAFARAQRESDKALMKYNSRS
ncbi:extracellular solute-binding protein [Streptomyces tubercidicus]